MRARARSLSAALLVLVASASTSQAQQPQQQFAFAPPKKRWVVVHSEQAQESIFAPDDKLRLIGVTLIVGLPDGIAPGISFHPWTNLMHIDLNLSGGLAFGIRGGVTLDPLDWVVAPTLTLSAGYSGWADLPFTTEQSIRFQNTYVSIQPGIEVGRRSRFRVFLRGGYSHLWADTDYYPSYSGNQATSSTKVRVGLFPSLNFGITGYL